MVNVAADVPADAKAKVDEVKAGLKAGTYSIWKGPIMNNEGKEMLAKDVVADDKFFIGQVELVKVGQDTRLGSASAEDDFDTVLGSFLQNSLVLC